MSIEPGRQCALGVYDRGGVESFSREMLHQQQRRDVASADRIANERKRDPDHQLPERVSRVLFTNLFRANCSTILSRALLPTLARSTGSTSPSHARHRASSSPTGTTSRTSSTILA